MAEVTGTPPGRRNRKSGVVEFLDDCEVSEQPTPKPVSRPQSLKRVKVLAPFSVSHNGTAYMNDSIAEVPASVAEHWLRNRWVTEQHSTSEPPPRQGGSEPRHRPD